MTVLRLRIIVCIRLAAGARWTSLASLSALSVLEMLLPPMVKVGIDETLDLVVEWLVQP